MPYSKSSVTDHGRGKNLTGFEYSHQHSNTAAEVPAASDLRLGELAVNSADGTVYYKTTGGAVAKVGDAPVNGTIYGRKDSSWVDLTSPANLQVNRGTASEVAAYVALAGEPVYDTTSKALHVGDGTTAGGSLIGAKCIVSGVSETDQSLGESYYAISSATIGPISSVWRLTGFLKFAGDPSGSSSPRINVGTGMLEGVDALGGYYTAINTNGSVVSGPIADAGDEITLTAAVAGQWSIHINLIVSLFNSPRTVSFPSLAATGDVSLTRSLLVAERLA